ncbi:unnamed protein product [Fraxinus pennsylvanica]|uniref:Uncharacterized protein n=1 Tax=Fraxinus pennsylvanica TaxID=56036 RepID=A0AAD1ZLX8_9LAMI|nr:unnamed protein product [Fraxinus pennsylvanica]
MSVIVQEGKFQLVYVGIDVINDVFEQDGEGEVFLTEERGIPGNVLVNVPEDAICGRLRGGGAEELSAVKPHSGNSIIVGSIRGDAEVEGHDGNSIIVGTFRGDAEVEGHVRPSAVLRRRVVSGSRQQANGVVEVVGEDWECA